MVYHRVHLLDGVLIEIAGFAILSATQQICLSVNLILCTFPATDKYKQVHHQQLALIPKYKSTPTCSCYCPFSSSGSINAERHIQHCYTALSVVNGKIYNANMLLKHDCLVLC
jgi:hypothetical protein